MPILLETIREGGFMGGVMRLSSEVIIGIVLVISLAVYMNRPSHDWEEIEASIQNYLDDSKADGTPPSVQNIIDIIERNEME